jgi:hypothetical protein
MVFLLSGIPSCRRSQSEPATETVLDDTSLHYMLPVVRESHDNVQRAEKMLEQDEFDVDDVKEALDHARKSLLDLEKFYLPATEARDDVFEAYREDAAHHSDKRDTYLASAKEKLARIAKEADPSFDPYVEELINEIGKIQTRIEHKAPVGADLKSLCDTFQLHLLKAQLAINQEAFREETP